MTRAESLARQDVIRSVLTAAGWYRTCINGTEFWSPPDWAPSSVYRLVDAIQNSIAARKHPYYKSVLKMLQRDRRDGEDRA